MTFILVIDELKKKLRVAEDDYLRELSLGDIGLENYADQRIKELKEKISAPEKTRNKRR